MTDSLELDDDLDSEAILLELESCFDICFTQTELRNCQTVGDLYAILRSRFASPASSGYRPAMTFYRLKRSVTHPDSGFKPNLRTDHIEALGCKFRTPFTADSEFRAETQLSLWDILAGCFIAGGAIALFAAGITQAPFWAAASALTAAIGVLLLHLDPDSRPPGYKTLSGLLRKLAGAIVRRPANEEAAVRDRELWNVLVEMLADYTHLPQREIGPETILLHRELRSTPLI